MSTPISLVGSGFVPTTSLTGGEPLSIYRGYNAIVRNIGGNPFVESYLGSKDLSENYDLVAELLTTAGNKIRWTAGSTTVTIASGAALTELRPGQMFLAGTEVFVVDKVDSNTSITVRRVPTTTEGTGVDGYYLPVLFEIDRQRGVLRRGNATVIERRDIILVGQGSFFLNGTDTTFDAARQAKRLQRAPETAVTTFVDGDVTVAANTITEAAHPYLTGQRVRLTTSGVLPAGLALATDYYVISYNAGAYQLASSLSNAYARTAVDITAAAGSGTHTVTAQPYTEVPWGFPDAPPTPVIDDNANGWKGMLATNYAFMVSWWNESSGGFSNPCVRIKQVAGVDIAVAASGRLTVDVSNLLVAGVKPVNADGIKVWGTLSGGGVLEVAAANFAEGALYEVCNLRFAALTITAASAANDTLTIPNHRYQHGDYLFYNQIDGVPTVITGLADGTGYWVLVKDKDTVQLAASVADLKTRTPVNIGADYPGTGDGSHTLSYFDANDVAYFEYLDSETGNVVTGDNDRPPECEWVTEFANELFYISAYGSVTATNPLGTSMGSYVVPGKGSNREAAPARWRVGMEDVIHGFAKGVGRLFCLTPSGLPFVTPTGRTELARLTGVALDLPFVSRPFWTKGGISPYNVTVIQGDVFAYSGFSPLRSPSNADENSAPFEIGKLIQVFTKDMPDGYVLTAHDPKNMQFCLVLSAVRKNSSDYWESEILPLDLATGVWQPKIKLSSASQDMIVSGIAVVNNRFEFLAGGRRAVGNPQMRTYRYDERAGSGSINWAVAFQPTDLREEGRAKYIRSFRATGRLTSPVVQVHGATWDSLTISSDDIEAGTNSLTGNISLVGTNGLRRRAFRQRRLVKNLSIFSVRVSGTWEDSGTNEVDLLDELVIDVGYHGGKH